MARPISILPGVELTQSHLEWLGRFIAAGLGGLFSPTWLMLSVILGPVLDMEAFRHVATIQPALVSFITRLHEHHGQLALSLLPALCLTFLVSVGYLYICSKLGEWFVRAMLTRFSVSNQQ